MQTGPCNHKSQKAFRQQSCVVYLFALLVQKTLCVAAEEQQQSNCMVTAEGEGRERALPGLPHIPTVS